jgi:type II restriction/modification system DNA methylase subunit YeeA
MDKKAIKLFAIGARNKLINEVKYEMVRLGINENNIFEPSQHDSEREIFNIGAAEPIMLYKNQIQQRNDLIDLIDKKGYENVTEEIAYTWFNRIIAIRFLEVNDYLPSKIRVLSSETKGKIEPDIITEIFNINLDLSENDIDEIHRLKDNNKLDELFQILFLKQCNKLNEILPELFSKTEDFHELLLSISFTKKDGIIRQLIDTIDEEDFKNEVEIIGWLYQYYNTELKDDTFAQMKKRVKISKERIPAATQLFTPDWIVKYMVENSLGRLWLEGHPNDELKKSWKYYLDETEQEENVKTELEKIKTKYQNISVEEIKILDPCMGSGHILTYVFDILMEIYLSQGYTKQIATISILKNNLYGLEIDDRAYQLAYFAIMMKARSYNRQIFKEKIELNITSIQESNGISNNLIEYVSNNDKEIRSQLEYLKNIFIDAKNYGSLIYLKSIYFNKIQNNLLNNLSMKTILKNKYFQDTKIQILPLIKQSNILSKKFNIVITNPPYMGSSGMNKQLSNFLKKQFTDSKRDLFAVFIEKCQNFTLNHGFIAMITQQSFMFLSSFEKLREKFLNNNIINMIHLGARAFEEIGGEVVQATSFVLQKSKINDYVSTFVKLSEENSEKLKEKSFLNMKNKFTTKTITFSKIPGSPIAYWIGPELINAFKDGKPLGDISDVKQGLATADNNRFLRFWHEVDINKIGFNINDFEYAKSSKYKWFPYNKGGDYRKWYGNQDYVVNWENDGFEIKNFKDKNNKLRSRPQNTNFYFKESITYTLLSSSKFGVRFCPKGFIFDVNGSSIFTNSKTMLYLLSFLASNICKIYLSILNSTMAFQVGDLKKLPLIYSEEKAERINKKTIENIEISKKDWDSSELSWNFKKNRLINSTNLIEDSFKKWENVCSKRFDKLKNNEQELNQIFINIYKLDNIITNEINENELTLINPNIEKEIMILLSYFVGCLFGRYSLDKDGLIFAGGKFDFSNYTKRIKDKKNIFLIPDNDNIVPILDSEYFEDDIVKTFEKFLKITFSNETLEENLLFIAKNLKSKGKTNREIIRNYFLNNFFKDHVKTYKKTPIYWLFSSGKENGFKALIYMHRYSSDLVARLRIEYLHKTQKIIELGIETKENIIQNSANDREISEAKKERNKLVKQLEETREYDEALSHIANQQISIDLDDGVKVNYAKFQNVEVINSSGKMKKINLLEKI